MTPTAAVRSILGDYVSEARCREVVVAVLRACREPSEGMLDAARVVTNGQSFFANYPRKIDAMVHRAMIDALIEEVTAG